MKSSNIKTIAGRILFFFAVCFIFTMSILNLLRMSVTTDGGFGLKTMWTCCMRRGRQKRSGTR